MNLLESFELRPTACPFYPHTILSVRFSASLQKSPHVSESIVAQKVSSSLQVGKLPVNAGSMKIKESLVMFTKPMSKR
jgi:hypothetical protein